VVITGANSGIGRETAVGLARLGAEVTIAVRNPTKGAEALADIRRRSGSDLVSQAQLDLPTWTRCGGAPVSCWTASNASTCW
jgi:NAD(P)-dependent dehydrogenase (short-subunit alcohol dehydrogenase family)